MQEKNIPSPFFVLLLIVSVLCSLTASVSTTMATPTVMSVTPSYVLVNAQSNFTVSIILTNSPPFMGFEATLNYNNSALEALNGNVTVPWTGSQLTIDNGTGTVTINGFNTVNPLEGNQTLAIVEFHALIHSNSSLDLTGTYLADPDYNVIPHTTESGFVEIVGPISLTVASAKKHYYVGTNITISGNATIEGSPIDTLIGLELISPRNTSIVRTVASGIGPSQSSGPINITEFYPSDQYGNHTNNFAAGSQAYFTIQIQNTANEELPYLLYINALDTYNASIGQTAAQGIIQPGSPALLISAVYLPYDVYNGTATAYAEAFSDWPHNKGIPYCPEQLATFYITNGLTTKPIPVPYGNMTFQSDYSHVFNLTSDYSFGNYSVYATAKYKTQTAAANTTFLNTVMCDFDGDGKVTAPDLNRLLTAFGSTPERGNWFPEADFNLDRKISAPDLNFLLTRFGQHI